MYVPDLQRLLLHKVRNTAVRLYAYCAQLNCLLVNWSRTELVATSARENFILDVLWIIYVWFGMTNSSSKICVDVCVS